MLEPCLHVSAVSCKLCHLFPHKWVFRSTCVLKLLADSTMSLRKVENEVTSQETHPFILPYDLYLLKVTDRS